MPTRSPSVGLPRRGPVRYALAALLLISAVDAKACPICFAGLAVTPGQQLDAAEQAVLAVPVIGKSGYRIVEVVKGKVTDRTIAGEVLGADGTTLRDGGPALLLRNGPALQWRSIGTIGVEYAGWLRRLALIGNTGTVRPNTSWPVTTQTSSAPEDARWRERVALVVSYLEHPEPLANQIAFGEISRAPYGAMRSLKPLLDAATIARWIDDPGLAARRPTYVLLLGIAGGSDEAASLEQRLEVAWQTHDATNLAAMLAADLELQGPSRVGRIEKAYLADRTRTLPEINAALLALSVQGGANAAIARDRVIEAYRFFINERKAMAGFVAMQLADWECWDATTDYVTLLRSDVVKDPASHFAIVNYLQRSPHPAARSALQSIANTPR
jgi:hypothetical protein